jgi:hypothetical protein
MQPELVTQAEFAKLRHVSPKTVAVWKQRGLLVRIGNKIHVEATNRLLDARPLKYHGGSTSARSNGEPNLNLGEASGTAPLSDDFENWTTAEAQRRKEICLALTRQHQLDIARGKFVLADAIEAEIRQSFRTTAQRLLLLPSKLAPRLASMKTAAEVEDLLYRECERALNALSEEAGARLLRHEAKH